MWARENTREALFDAMERKEVYGTTGPRMLVRFFGGWEFEANDANTRQPAKAGYSKGVPMGGDLRNAPAGADDDPGEGLHFADLVHALGAYLATPMRRVGMEAVRVGGQLLRGVGE